MGKEEEERGEKRACKEEEERGEKWARRRRREVRSGQGGGGER